MLFSVWFDYVGWLALVLEIQVCQRAGFKVICTWLLVLSIVARACQSFKNGAREWRWQTRAQLTRRVFVETSMSWAGSDTGRHRAAISCRVACFYFFYFFIFYFFLIFLFFCFFSFFLFFFIFYFLVDHWSSLLDLYIAWNSAMRFFIFRFCCYGIVMTLLLGRPCISSQPMGCWYVVGSSFL